MKENEFMQEAIRLSHEGAIVQKSGGVFGAVVVKEGKIVGRGYNKVILHNDPTWHGEMEAIREACKALKTPHLDGCVLYTSAECCPMCLAAAYWAHIEKIYYASTMEDAFTYGNFADVDFLEEIRKEPEGRRIQMEQCCREEALVVWKEFAQMSNRLHY